MPERKEITDSERMDWFEEWGLHPEVIFGQTLWKSIGRPLMTIRQAIDAAMATEEGSGE